MREKLGWGAVLTALFGVSSCGGGVYPHPDAAAMSFEDSAVPQTPADAAAPGPMVHMPDAMAAKFDGNDYKPGMVPDVPPYVPPYFSDGGSYVGDVPPYVPPYVPDAAPDRPAPSPDMPAAPPDAAPDSAGAACPADPYFTEFPIPLSEIQHISVLGGFSPPGHTLPTDHLGIYLNSKGIPFKAPATMQIWNLRRVRYLASPNRQGETDWAIEFKLCDTLVGTFGHMPTLSVRLAALFVQPHCETYSTTDETVEACSQQNITGQSIQAGELVGTVGGPSAGAFDFDFYDYNHTNAFININRIAFLGRHSVCPLDHFATATRDSLLAKVSPDGIVPRTEEPRCGTMEIDVPNTAQGLWVRKDMAVSQGSDESMFVALALDPGQPSAYLALSAGPAAVGARLYRFPRLHTGRVNRDYREMSPDGTIYCYDGDRNVPTTAVLASFSATGELTLERVDPIQGASPCTQDPSQWKFTSAVLVFIR